MNKNQMAELLYALPDGVVVKGRKSKVVPLCLTLAGVVLLVVNGLLPATAGDEDLKSALVLFGGWSGRNAIIPNRPPPPWPTA